jgi:hypothetical protein
MPDFFATLPAPSAPVSYQRHENFRYLRTSAGIFYRNPGNTEAISCSAADAYPLRHAFPAWPNISLPRVGEAVT